MLKIHPKSNKTSSKKHLKVSLWTAPGQAWDPNRKRCANSLQNGTQRDHKWSHLGTMGHLKSVKNHKKTFKNPTGIRDQKKSEKVWTWDPPEPQKVGFRWRGVQIWTNPPKPLKIIKSHQKGSKMSSKWSPRGPKQRPRTPRNPLKKSEGKRHQKDKSMNLS